MTLEMRTALVPVLFVGRRAKICLQDQAARDG